MDTLAPMTRRARALLAGLVACATMLLAGVHGHPAAGSSDCEARAGAANHWVDTECALCVSAASKLAPPPTAVVEAPAADTRERPAPVATTRLEHGDQRATPPRAPPA